MDCMRIGEYIGYKPGIFILIAEAVNACAVMILVCYVLVIFKDMMHKPSFKQVRQVSEVLAQTVSKQQETIRAFEDTHTADQLKQKG